MLAPPYASTWAWIGYLAATLGVVIGVSGYLIRRRRLRARLRQSLYEQRQRELVYESCIWSFSNLTNELSIPVTLINGPCQQIMGCKSADAFVRRQAELIRHNAQKINDLIYMLNEFQSTDPVDGSDDIEMLDVSRTAGGIAQTFADYAGENRIAYRTAVGSGVLFPSVRNILMMIFNILLSNAFRRTEPGGEVSVSVGICSVPRPDGAASGAGEETSGAAERLRIEVSNRGVELDAGQIELIFDRYKLLNHLGALSRQGVSLKEDLELAICYNLVTKLQGEFRVESRDGLTTFTLSLPRLEITRAARSAAQPDIAPGQRFSQPVPVPEASVMTFGDMLPTMLVINEDRDMADFIAGLFSGGYNVRIVSDLKCPQEKLAEAQPQIIICGTVSLNAAMIGLIRSIRKPSS
ncbi:MAG: sensor histidine kinase [Alistipes shahii]